MALSPIAVRWLIWGGADGAFGEAKEVEQAVPGFHPNARRQQFRYGEISWTPPEEFIVSVVRLRNQACLHWIAPFVTSREIFRYEIALNGVAQPAIEAFMRSGIWVRLQGVGEYSFRVSRLWIGGDGKPDGPWSNWSVPVRLQFDGSTETPEPNREHSTTLYGQDHIPDELAPRGWIAERWRELGAWDGPLGLPMTEEVVDPGSGAVSQRFEHGSIATAPEFGPRMVVAAYQRGPDIELNWGGAAMDPPRIAVRARFDGTQYLAQSVTPNASEWAHPHNGSGLFRIRADRGNGLYEFFLSDSVFGHALGRKMPGVSVNVVHSPGDAFIDAPALDGTHGGAFASHKVRASAIARCKAIQEPLRVGLDAGDVEPDENNTIQLIAHFQAVSDDRDFRTPGELPSRIIAPILLGQMRMQPGHLVGTTVEEDDVPFAAMARPGDYDPALKGLMVIANRYRKLINEAILDHLLRHLVPLNLRGPHDPNVESYWVGPEILPETENHMLMIESSRYLVNQFLFEFYLDPKYDNDENGMTMWLLSYLQTLAKHDFLEFNSRPYQRYSLHALLNLAEFARDPVKTAARIVLDYSMVKFAVSSSWQRRICPFRRQNGRLNRPDEWKYNVLRRSDEGDEVAEFFGTYVGPLTIEGKPEAVFPAEWLFNGVIAGTADYRPPPAAYILGMRPPREPVQHRFYHGARPRVPEAEEDADGGVEIYFKSPSFQLTAGGMFLNSGYGGDEWTGYKQTAITQSTTLLPERADVTFADLIRFDRYVPVTFEPLRKAVNIGVHQGFACGANLVIPDRWQQFAQSDGPWLFINFDAPPAGSLGFYAATFRAPLGDPWKLQPPTGKNVRIPLNLGFLYALEATTMSFDDFVRRTIERNPLTNNAYQGLSGHKLIYRHPYVFHSPEDPPADRRFTFWIDTASDKYAPRILKINDQPTAYLASLPLAEGPFLSTPGGHDGRIEIRHPGCPEPLVLDFRDDHKPVYRSNAKACPQPWLDRANALRDFAYRLYTLAVEASQQGRVVEATAKHKQAADAMVTRVRLYEGLIDADLSKHLPGLVVAIYQLLDTFRKGLQPTAALSFAQQGVVAAEVLADMRFVTGPGPVLIDGASLSLIDYQDYTPNQYWDHPYLAGALYNLAVAYREINDKVSATQWMVQRVRLYERMTEADPSARKGLSRAIYLLLDTYRSGLKPSEVLYYAHRGVTVNESLAGLLALNPAGSVNYDGLTAFAPNEYWAWPYLTGALYNLAYACKAAGDMTAGSKAMKDRVKVAERMVQVDPIRWQEELDRAHTQAAAFGL
jgi:hypothetical protein